MNTWDAPAGFCGRVRRDTKRASVGVGPGRSGETEGSDTDSSMDPRRGRSSQPRPHVYSPARTHCNISHDHTALLFHCFRCWSCEGVSYGPRKTPVGGSNHVPSIYAESDTDCEGPVTFLRRVCPHAQLKVVSSSRKSTDVLWRRDRGEQLGKAGIS